MHIKQGWCTLINKLGNIIVECHLNYALYKLGKNIKFENKIIAISKLQHKLMGWLMAFHTLLYLYKNKFRDIQTLAKGVDSCNVKDNVILGTPCIKRKQHSIKFP